MDIPRLAANVQNGGAFDAIPVRRNLFRLISIWSDCVTNYVLFA